MRIIVVLVAALFVSTGSATCQIMSWQGVGGVRLGMTVAEAEQVLQAPLSPKGVGFTDDCWVTQRSDGKDETIRYQVARGKIVVIAAAPDPQTQQSTKVTDTRGIGVGASEADIRRAYGEVKIGYAPGYSAEDEIQAAKERARLGVKLSEPEPAPEYWVEVESPNHERELVFDTRDSRVLWLRTGFKPAVTEAEDCSN